MNLIEKLEKEILQQTRNGRDTLYMETDDLREIGIHIDENKQGRVYVDAQSVESALKRYKFKDSLKVQPTQEHCQKIQRDKQLEKEISESWDSISK